MAIDKDCMKRWDEFGGQVGRHCRDCEDRYPGCHGTCEKYLEAKKEYDEFKRVVFENRNDNMRLYTHKINAMRKARKNRKG